MINYEIELDDLEGSACKEMNGPGNFLRHHALIKKIREIGHFRITSGLFFKASLGAHPFINATQFSFTHKLNSFSCE